MEGWISFFFKVGAIYNRVGKKLKRAEKGNRRTGTWTVQRTETGDEDNRKETRVKTETREPALLETETLLKTTTERDA